MEEETTFGVSQPLVSEAEIGKVEWHQNTKFSPDSILPPPSYSTAAANASPPYPITPPYDSQPRHPLFVPCQPQFMTTLPPPSPSGGGYQHHTNDGGISQHYLKGDYRDGDRRKLGEDGRPLPRRHSKAYSKVEKELMTRAKEKGIDRATARQTLRDKLVWREGNNTEQVVKKRWLLVVISDEYVDDLAVGRETKHRVPNEIVCFAMENTKIVEERRFANKEAKFDYPGMPAYRFNPRSPEEIDHMFVHMSKFLQNSWDNLILVTSALHWIKQRRDMYNRRDTASIRLDRLICLEDVISVFREVHGKMLFDMDDDDQWEQLREMRISDTVIYGRATCEYFTSSLMKSLADDPSLLADEPNSIVKVLRVPQPLSESLLKSLEDRKCQEHGQIVAASNNEEQYSAVDSNEAYELKKRRHHRK